MAVTKSKTVSKEVATPDKYKAPAKTKLDTKKVKKDHLMAFVYWAKVTSTNINYASLFNPSPRLDVQNVDNGEKFSVHGNTLIEESYSADVYADTVTVSKTKAAEMLVSAYNKPFTVAFEKLDGELRVLRGRLVQPEPLLGRSMVEDLDLAEGSYRLRQVDHRTIQSLIVDNVKYLVK